MTAILVALGNALMAEGLCQLLQLHGYRCWVGKRQAEPHAIIVDSATIGKASSLGYPRAKILFLQMEQDVSHVTALLSWHRAHAIIPPSSGLEGFKRALQAVDGERSRAWSRAPAGTEAPVPFTSREKKVIACICRKAMLGIEERDPKDMTCMGMGVGMLKWRDRRVVQPYT